MNALGSPVEALALNYLSYGFSTAVNNIWAWVAVITAAVGLWRMKASSSPRKVAALPSSPEKMAAEPVMVETPASSTTSFCVLEGEGSPKGKFSVYYYKDGFKGSDNGGDDDVSGGGAVVVSEKLGWSGDDWERMMVVRMGDMGWYNCQDLKVLDGSVVRLWDGRRRRRDAAGLVADGGLIW